MARIRTQLRRRSVSRSRRLFVEHLEDRRLLTTSIWTGANAAVDVRWSDSANWQGNVVPANGDDVVSKNNRLELAVYFFF